MDYKHIIEKHYNLRVNTIKLLDSHFGTEIYRLDTDGHKYILKCFPSYMENAKSEGHITNFLSSNGIKVSQFLKTYSDYYFVTLDDTIITVQEYIEGATFQVNTAPDWFIDESAQILGKINAVLKNYTEMPIRFGNEFFCSDNVISKKNLYKNELLAATKHNNDEIVSRYKEQLRHLSRISKFVIDTSKLTYSNSHGDFHIGQAVVNGNEITIIDWASACRLPICLEVVTSFVFANPKCKDGSIDVLDLKRYIEKYRLYSALSEYDIKAMPYVLYFWHCMCNYSPHEEISDNYKPIAELIRNILEWLHDNVDVLSEGLCIPV